MYAHTFYYDAPSRNAAVSMSSMPYILLHRSTTSFYACVWLPFCWASVHFLIDHRCSHMSSSIFSYRATLKEGEHAFLCIPCLPNIFNSRFWRKGLEHGQLKLIYAPVMVNTGFGLHQYNPHMNIMRVRGNEVALVTSHALCGNLGQRFIWRQTCLLFF